MMALAGVNSEEKLISLVDKMVDLPEVSKVAKLLSSEEAKLAILAGYKCCLNIESEKGMNTAVDKKAEEAFVNSIKTEFMEDL